MKAKFQRCTPVDLVPVLTDSWVSRTVGLGVLGNKKSLALAWKISALKFLEAHCTQTLFYLTTILCYLPPLLRCACERATLIH